MERETFRAETEKELALFLDAIEGAWGFRPPVEVKVETKLRVSADFNIVGFAHKGSGFDVRDSNAHRRTPKAVARAFAQEIIAHRNTCGECGTGTPTLRARIDYNSYRGTTDHYTIMWHNQSREKYGAAMDQPADAA